MTESTLLFIILFLGIPAWIIALTFVALVFHPSEEPKTWAERWIQLHKDWNK